MNFWRNSQRPLTPPPSRSFFWENVLQIFSEIHDQNSGWISTKFAMNFFRLEMTLPLETIWQNVYKNGHFATLYRVLGQVPTVLDKA